MATQSINLGCHVFNEPESFPPERTIVVLGIARGGTSFLASTVAHLGIPFDQEPPNYDNPELSAAISGGDWDSYRQQVEAINARYPVWGTKIMANAAQSAQAISMLRNPILLCVFRDPCAVAVRKQMVGRPNYTQVQAGVKASLKQYIRLVDMLALAPPHPMMYVSYGNAVQSAGAFVGMVNEFLGHPIADLPPARAIDIAQDILGEGAEYRRAKTRKARRQANKFQEAARESGLSLEETGRLARAEARRLRRREQAERKKRELKRLKDELKRLKKVQAKAQHAPVRQSAARRLLSAAAKALRVGV